MVMGSKSRAFISFCIYVFAGWPPRTAPPPINQAVFGHILLEVHNIALTVCLT